MPRARQEQPHLARWRGKFAIVFWEGNQRRRISTGTSDQQIARQVLADFEAKLERHPLKLTFADALDRYEAARAGKITAPQRLKEAAKPLRAALGDLRVDQLRQSAWDRYAAGRQTRPGRHTKPENHKPRPVSVATLRREFNVLRAALRQAWKDGFLLKPPSITGPADSAPRDRYITRAEAKSILDAARITPHVYVFASLAFYTGARKGSILALQWNQVDFQQGVIDFQEPGRKLTAKRRAIVPMNQTLRATLLEARQAAQSDYVVEYAGAAVPTGLRWSWARLCQRAGLSWRPTPHHVKHSVVSWLAMANIPIDQAADLLATDPATLRRVYRKFDPAYLRPATAALEL